MDVADSMLPCVAWVSIDPRQSAIDLYPGHVARMLEDAWQGQQVSVNLGSSFFDATVILNSPTFLQQTARGNRDVRRIELAAPSEEVLLHIIHQGRRGWRVSDHEDVPGAEPRSLFAPRESLLMPLMNGSDAGSKSRGERQSQSATKVEVTQQAASMPSPVALTSASEPELPDVEVIYRSCSPPMEDFLPVSILARSTLRTVYLSVAIGSPGECKICFEVLPGLASEPSENQLVTLGCPSAHRFCRSCLLQHAGVQRFPRCPAEKCTYELSEQELVYLGCDEEKLSTFRKSVLDRAIHGLGKVVQCPNPECTSVCMIDEESQRERFECACGWPAWCTNCRQPYHYHTDCGEVQSLRQRWLEWVSQGRAIYHHDFQVYKSQEAQRLALEDAMSRHTELQDDEVWKSQNCRQCPRCRRPVQKTEGCDQMVCGMDAHGGNQQSGCGHRFNWKSARPYKAVAQTARLPPLDAEEVRLRGAHLRHAFCRCSLCGADIVGPRFCCIHCTDFNLCVHCDRKCEPGLHFEDHVFKIFFEPEYDLGTFLPVGTEVEIIDGSDRHGWRATVIEHTQRISDPWDSRYTMTGDWYTLRLVSDKSTRTLERSQLQPHLKGVRDVGAFVKAQLDEEQRAKERRAKEQRAKEQSLLQMETEKEKRRIERELEIQRALDLISGKPVETSSNTTQEGSSSSSRNLSPRSAASQNSGRSLNSTSSILLKGALGKLHKTFINDGSSKRSDDASAANVQRKALWDRRADAAKSVLARTFLSQKK